MDIKTACVHGALDHTHSTGSITVPIYQTATFGHPGVGETTGYDYSRLQNPTREQLENVVAKLEGGVDAMAFSTGMAAISAIMELFKIGDHIIASHDLYGGSHRLFSHISEKNGLTFDFVDTSDSSEIEKYVTLNTRAVFIETPTNPMMHVTDIEAVASIAKRHQLLLIVDNTFLTPYFQRPLEFGADIVMHSGTKYLSGHNDTLSGFLVAGNEEVAERLRFIGKTTGACLAPFDSWLMIRGIKTLAIRMEKQQKNAIEIVDWLLSHPKIKKVHYVGLETHPSYAVSKKQASGFGAMISVEVDCEATARNVLERVKLIIYAESLGGVETLITYPMMQTHADVPKAQRDARGINERLLRLSVGIEDAQDLIADLKQALD